MKNASEASLNSPKSSHPEVSPADPTRPPGHLVQFFETDDFLVQALAEFVENGIFRAEAVIVLATEDHRLSLEARLNVKGVDLKSVRQSGQFQDLDARAALSSFTVNGQLDRSKFNENILALIQRAQARFGRVRVYGEMVGLLYGDNNTTATVELEKLWHELVSLHSFSLFCGYSINSFNGVNHAQAFADICDNHSKVMPAESYLTLKNEEERLREIALLQQKAQALEKELERRREAELALLKANESLHDELLSRQQAERLLEQAQEFQKLILDSNRDCIKVLDLDSKILFVNRGAFETIGICHENEVVGKHWLNYWQGEEAQAASRAFEAALKGGIGECVTTTQQNGTSKYWHAVINPIYDENRKVSKLLVVSRDVTEKKRAESALSESEAQFRTLADSIPQLAWTANADGFIFWYNQRWYEYTGTTPSQMEGWGWQSVHDPEFLPKVLERWKQSISTGTPFDMEFPLRRADGVYRTFLTRVQPIKNSLGQIIRWFGTNTDVEEQRRSREVLKTINEVGQKITAELDLNRLVQSVTDAATKLTGAEFGAFFYNLINDEGESYTLYTLSGAPLEAFSKFPMPRNTAIFGPTFEGTCVVRSDDIRKDPRYGKNAPYYGMPKGHLPVVSYLAVPVISRSGEVLGGLFFGHSKSGVFSSQEEDLILALSAQTAIAIDNARLFQKSKEAIQARDEFLSIASHELKTPLTPLKMQVQSLKRFIAKGALSQVAPERLHSIAETSDRQINRIATLIEDLLDVSRITSGKFSLNREEVDLVEVVREALDRYEPQITAAKCPVELRLPETLKGRWDKLRVEQVVINLLTNAIKYAPQAPITITAQVVGDQAELSVSDRGMGIAEADQKRIFDRFERVQSSKNVGGLGLGLFITRQIIETHGGRIQVSSRPNAGATFTVQLPLRARE